MNRVIGIDLGTTFSVASVIEDGRAIVIPNKEGSNLTPSVVAVTRDGRKLVGQLARRQAVANPENTIASIKRHMGSDYKVKLRDREYTPQEISALILQKVKNDTQDYLGEEINRAVITVPAYFNDGQRQATKDAGVIAGLEVLRIINEPTAAALAYGLDREDIHTVLIWDLGGGTFDVSILELSKGVFEVKAVNGNTWLGGDDWDVRLMNYMADEFKKIHNIDLRGDRMCLQRLKEEAERAKIELSSKTVTNIRIPFIVTDQEGPKNLEMTLTREEFQEMTRDILEKMIEPTKQAMSDAGLEPRDIDRVVLVGGSSRMPAVQDLVRDMIGKEPYKDINPDEVVAVGAGIQAGVLTGEIKGVVLIDVTPLSLGIETQGGLFAKIIERNTTIPTSKGQIFTTASDNQTSVDIHVLQGEREIAQHNISLGRFELADIPLMRRGEPKIEVTFEIDVNGITHVSAKDLLTDNEQRVKITSSKKLSKEEIDRMLKEAQLHAEEDRSRKEEIQIYIKAENMICAAQAAFEEGNKKVDKSFVDKVEKAILEVKDALASGNIDEVKGKTSDLQKLVELLYAK